MTSVHYRTFSSRLKEILYPLAVIWHDAAFFFFKSKVCSYGIAT